MRSSKSAELLYAESRNRPDCVDECEIRSIAQFRSVDDIDGL
jgi:hypothetical protein